MVDEPKSKTAIEMTADIVSAYVAHNQLAASEVQGLIRAVHDALGSVGQSSKVLSAEKTNPAVPIKKSVTPDYLISLEDGRKYKSLKRHLRTKYNMTPEDYRAKWGLPKDYPMVAPNYAATRSALAKTIGLGRGGTSASRAKPPSDTAAGKR